MNRKWKKCAAVLAAVFIISGGMSGQSAAAAYSVSSAARGDLPIGGQSVSSAARRKISVSSVMKLKIRMISVSFQSLRRGTRRL